MYPHSSFLIALGAWPTLGKAGFRVRPDRPDIPVSPPRNPYNHDPVVPGFTYPGYDRIQIPPQAELQTNMQSLEQRLEAVNVALDAGEEVVQAILAVVSTTITSVDMTFTPTTTLSSTSYTACLSYASILDSCSSSTNSFYSLPATAQASCVCYTSGAYTSLPCSNSGMQGAAVQTLDVNFFDSKASQCYDFFEKQGYGKVATALDGKDGNRTVLGKGFCGNVDADLLRVGHSRGNGTATGTRGLELSLKPVASGECLIRNAEVKGQAPLRGFTAFDRAVFFTFPVVLGFFSWLMLL